ncbi:MAG: NAD(P)H-binding protein [Bdellovibrionia bacterium]
MKKKPILVTGVGGNVGGVGQKIVDNLLQAGEQVRAFVRHPNPVASELERNGAEIVSGDLTDLHDVHRALKDCERIYFGMGVSEKYLEATVNVAAVAKYYGVKAFVNISQMTVSQMSITETTSSTQQKLQWLSEQVLNWSGLPVVHVRPTAFIETLFLLSQSAIKNRSELRLPFGKGKTSPIAANDVAFALSTILLNPGPHVGKVYELTGPTSETLDQVAKELSQGLKKELTYVDPPLDEWSQRELAPTGLPLHTRQHLETMAVLHQQNRYDRYTKDFKAITGRDPISIEKWATSYPI